jgi:hypothetical protein
MKTSVINIIQCAILKTFVHNNIQLQLPITSAIIIKLKSTAQAWNIMLNIQFYDNSNNIFPFQADRADWLHY